eukprot:TRINITY_DN15439_c0_g5_i1.p1 TRINITY_DN15439_c0_g5~~TRINITY_DN15439_c0_g5_i1.p1  ORF type:complete len:500 (-),score=130.66 TRINITY_DN15439_c0_g5_i1:126-1574(-)
MAVRSKDTIGGTTQTFFEALYAARDADANEIADGLFLGAAKASDDRRAMQKRKISHVLIAHPGMPEKHPDHFKYGRCSLLDIPSFNLLQHLPETLYFLRDARSSGGKVFIYCAKGISRSSSICIALLMLEQGIGFEEAWSFCERKRPIVYPNVGFQQQLRHLERLLATQIDSKASWQEQIKQLKEVVPKGDLEIPKSPLPIRDLIGNCMGQAFDKLEELVEKVLMQPQLLQKREVWKRQGLFFENLHKYETMPGDLELVDRARKAADQLRSLPKIFSNELKGIKLALAVVKELEGWIRYAEPRLKLLQKEKEAAEGKKDSDDESEKGGKKDKKKDKKEKEKNKKEKKLEKKAKKAEKKAKKKLAKIEKAMKEAEELAKASMKESEEAEQMEKAIAEQMQREEEEAEFEERQQAARDRAEAEESAKKAQELSQQLREAEEEANNLALGRKRVSRGDSDDDDDRPPPKLRKTAASSSSSSDSDD